MSSVMFNFQQETLENSTASLEKEEVKEEKGYEVAMSALTSSLSTQYGGSNPYLYSQFSLCTKDQKINQIILIQVMSSLYFDF